MHDRHAARGTALASRMGMPEKRTTERARAAKRAGKAPSTQAGEYVREEIHHVREGKHGARSAKQAIAIGLSKARRAGVAVKPKKKAAAKTRAKAERDIRRGSSPTQKTTTRRASSARKTPSRRATTTKAEPSPRRSRAVRGALKREGRSAASSTALSRQAHRSARTRTSAERSAAAKKAARTKTPAERKAAAKKAAATRKRRAASRSTG
ncbi:TolA protein [Minicystis rosea]|nr:TolA protein [Minicystis rosea]